MAYKCSFCSDTLEEGRGKIFARNDGKVFYFCDSKCQKNFKLGREGKKRKWTQAYSKAKKS